MNPNKRPAYESGDPMEFAGEKYTPGHVRGDKARTELYARVVVLQEQQSTLNADMERLKAQGDTAGTKARLEQLAVISADLAEAKRELQAVDSHLAKMGSASAQNDN